MFVYIVQHLLQSIYSPRQHLLFDRNMRDTVELETLIDCV